MSATVLGFELGALGCAVSLASAGSDVGILDRRAFFIEAGQAPQHVLERMAAAGHELLTQCGVSAPVAVGVSCAAHVDVERGVILPSPEMPGWEGVNVAGALREALGTPAFIQSAANACALVEWKLGAGRGKGNVVFCSMGTTFRAGIIAEGKLVQGASGLAGEAGHIRMDYDGPLVYGKEGSLAGFCSAEGLAKLAQRYTKRALGRGHTPKWIADGNRLEGLSAKLVADYALAGDEDGLAIFEEAGQWLGQFLATVVDLLNPEVIVVGGLYARLEPLLRPAMQRSLQAEALPRALAACHVTAPAVGDKIADYTGILTACHGVGLDVGTPEHPAKEGALTHYEDLFAQYPQLEECREDIAAAFLVLRRAFLNRNKLLVCGDGPSAADADHVAAELMKGFYLRRVAPAPFKYEVPGLQGALPAISLTPHTSLAGAIAGDGGDPTLIFAQQVYGYGQPGDVFFGISASGGADPVCSAAVTARLLGMPVLTMTGKGGGQLPQKSDVCIRVPAEAAARVQELHLPVYHCLCAMLEEEFFGAEA